MRECPTGDSCEIPSGQQMGICRVYLTVGATCVPQVALCEPNTLYCDSTTTKCALRKPEGATCVTVSECQAGLECTASKCVKQEASCALLF
jgi:hypothetical protein